MVIYDDLVNGKKKGKIRKKKDGIEVACNY